MIRPPFVFVAVVALVLASCDQSQHPRKPVNAAAIGKAIPPKPTATAIPKLPGDSYKPPTPEEMAPMRPEYMTELAKVYEPPEMTSKPLQSREPVSPSMIKLAKIIESIESPDKATHEQRAAAIRDLVDMANNSNTSERVDRAMIYGVVAITACLDGAPPKAVIEYASKATDTSNDAVALRAKMYLAVGDKKRALDDLEKLMAPEDGHALAGGDAEPQNNPMPCKWGAVDFDRFDGDPRGVAAKGLYLSSFIRHGDQVAIATQESEIRNLFQQAASAWHSPIPYYLETTFDGLGSSKFMNQARCMRAPYPTAESPETISACASLDDAISQEIRKLTMALVINPGFAIALAERAERYLQLAQGAYADGKPSYKLYASAISDFDKAIAANLKDSHSMYCDRALAFAAIGKYAEAASSYRQGMSHAASGVETSPFVYEQLARLYMKMKRFGDAADVISQAIANASGGGMDVVLTFGGIKAFRSLYPEYNELPDEILADAIRRRYQPQFPQTWNEDFITKASLSPGKIPSSILPELYVVRGDAYIKAGRRAEAKADYDRVKSDVWGDEERLLPRHVYFDEKGRRVADSPDPWPTSPPST